MNEVYVIAGGEWLRNNLNAIAAFMGTRTWDSIEKIALTLSVLAVAVMWVQRHNVMDLLGWVAVFVLISLLVNVRTSVQIIDNSDLVKVHRVDNVPVGLAMPLSLTTRIGHAMVASYEMIFTQMSEDLSQQFAQYVMKHAPQDAEAILTNTSSPEIAERRRAMAWSFVQEQIQPGVDNAWRESRGDIGKGMESVPSGGGSQDIIADHQGHQAIIEQRTQDSNIRNDVKHQVDNMVTEYKGNIGDTQNSIRGEENIVRGQYSELQNHHKTEALSQNNKYNEEKSAQERMPGADSPQELMKRAKEYQDKYKQ